MDPNSVSEQKSISRPSIDWAKAAPCMVPCPVCGVPGDKGVVLAAQPSWGTGNFLDLVACPNCASKFFVNFEPPKYEHLDNSELYLKFYLEVGAGIDQLVRHLFCVRLGAQARYLEIGCGFGFALDFARRAFGIDVRGVDPSPYAAAGARDLDLPIITDYLTQDTDLGGSKFDLVVASEVIEHIYSPVAFLQLIARQLLPGGVLILTTPNAASVAPTTPQGTLIPLLSAGWHYILYSSDGLARVLRSAGFGRVEVIVRDHTLVAAATNGDAAIDLAAPIERTAFRDYLDDRRHSVQNDWLRHGLGYRLFKDLTNAGQPKLALAVYGDLRAQILKSYGIDLEIPHERWLTRGRHEAFPRFALRYPMCLCGIAYFRGVLALNHDNDPHRALQFFSLSVRYGAMLRAMLHGVGADDAETERIIQQSEVLRLRALAYTAPAEAAECVLNLLHPGNDSPLDRQRREEAIELFVHLVNLGALKDAERLAGEIARDLRSKGADAVSDRRRVELHRAFGILELNQRHRPREAALHFALSERIARRCSARDPEWAWPQIWHRRFERMLAWSLAENPDRGLLVGRTFTHRVARLTSPDRDRAVRLLCDLHRAAGLVKINQHHRPRDAALHFALSEHAAWRFYASEPEWAWERICHARHDRLLAWIVAGNAVRALIAGRLFVRSSAPRPILPEIAESAARLIAQAAASINVRT